MIAERNFVTEDHSMLRFHKGDIIRLQVMDGLEKGETLYYVQLEPCYLVRVSMIKAWARLCVSPPGYSYGCVVRKMVVHLEEMKRDTPDFGKYLLVIFI